MRADTLVSFRIEPKLKSAAVRRAKRDEINFSGVLRILLRAYVRGDVNIRIETKQKKRLRG